MSIGHAIVDSTGELHLIFDFAHNQTGVFTGQHGDHWFTLWADITVHFPRAKEP